MFAKPGWQSFVAVILFDLLRFESSQLKYIVTKCYYLGLWRLFLDWLSRYLHNGIRNYSSHNITVNLCATEGSVLRPLLFLKNHESIIGTYSNSILKSFSFQNYISIHSKSFYCYQSALIYSVHLAGSG